jgi:hypothetical protein
MAIVWGRLLVVNPLKFFSLEIMFFLDEIIFYWQESTSKAVVLGIIILTTNGLFIVSVR